MFWNTPPKKQVYEALGCLADGRLEVTGTDDSGIIRAKVYSSSRNKYYDVSFHYGINAFIALH